ncbi:MAG: hypothetical protein Q9217_006858 [Psora testacea]
MPEKAKRKWNLGSKSLFGSRVPNKVVVVEDASQDHLSLDVAQHEAVNVSLSDVSAEGIGGRCRMTRMRKGGSKFLSIVGLQRNSEIHPTKECSILPSDKGCAISISGNATTRYRNAQTRPSIHGGPASPRSLQLSQTLLTEPGISVCLPTSMSPTDEVRRQLGPESALLHSGDRYSRRREPSGSRQSMSSPNFAHQLSHKISATFGNPTIVHRPNLRSRISVLSIQIDDRAENTSHEQVNSPQDSTAPSSVNYSGSTSAGGYSTGKTSLDSNVASTLSTLQREGVNKLREAIVSDTATGREKSLTPIQEIPLDAPTILTVETAANAKIYFETYYDHLLAGDATSRSLRRRELECRLDSQATAEEHRRCQRWAWANCESDHLRQLRVLRNKSNQGANNPSVAVGGYEVVRILGKGSFGVVRLVREKESNSASTRLDPTVAQVWRQPPHGELIHPGPGTSKALRPTINDPTPQQRQYSNKACCDVYAMKVIRKSDMLRNCQEGHLRAERDFLVASEKSRWVVPLIASFQDRTNLYLVMEYMIGGDFLGLLFRRNVLKERHARWYIAEMILSIEETHRHRWIHRDIKPDNFLISASGHLKISDFGLAFDGHWSHDQRFYKNHRKTLMEKLGIEVRGDLQDQEEDAKKAPRNNLANILTGLSRQSRDNAQVDGPCEDESILQWRDRECKRRMAVSVVGTSQYMAPEVIRGDLYDGRCDWWSIGIILYEDNRNSLRFPNDREYRVSREAIHLIGNLLQEKEHRLSSKKYMLNDYQHSRRVPGQLINTYADPNATDYRGRFVYPDDATDIKGHPFFGRIVWDRHHLTRPPFVPDTSSLDDTKYFDEEDPISDIDDAASQSDSYEDADQGGVSVNLGTNPATQADGQHYQVMGGATIGNTKAPSEEGKNAKGKTKKRPRDKVLRDKEVGRHVLELRKKGAFIGYTYRRPNLVSLNDERGKQWQGRRSLIRTFDRNS